MSRVYAARTPANPPRTCGATGHRTARQKRALDLHKAHTAGPEETPSRDFTQSHYYKRMRKDEVRLAIREGERTPMSTRATEQRTQALKEANRIRTYRSGVKQQVRSRHLSPAAVLFDPDCATMLVIDLLVALPRVGRVRANQIMRRVGVSPSRSLADLTGRQRAELESVLRSIAGTEGER
jgi:hypothetical protein